MNEKLYFCSECGDSFIPTELEEILFEDPYFGEITCHPCNKILGEYEGEW